jgi:hypothetical protein
VAEKPPENPPEFQEDPQIPQLEVPKERLIP